MGNVRILSQAGDRKKPYGKCTFKDTGVGVGILCEKVHRTNRIGNQSERRCRGQKMMIFGGMVLRPIPKKEYEIINMLYLTNNYDAPNFIKS